jgi:arylsulfatase A-like enzyme
MLKRPNILIFNPDEMRADALGHLGNPAAHTPYLDAFAKTEAVSFANAYCQNPVCVPSRCSFMTGLYPHVNGHRTMGYLLQMEETSLLKELKEAGYYVWANARNDLVAGEIDGLAESHVSEMFYGGNLIYKSQPKNAKPKRGEKGFYSFYTGELEADPKEEIHSADDEDVQAAVDRILHPITDQPLCMFVGLMYPHPPYQVEEPYYSMIDRHALPPRIQASQCRDKAKILSELRYYQGLQDYSEQEWNELKAVYLGMCAKIDAQFKRICDALKEAGIYDDTAIFFLSDHGDFAGDYDIPEKAQNTFEDCLTRVPLLIKPTKDFPVDAGITYGMSELVDFYATVMDMAGVTPDHTQFGQSLVPVLKDRKEELRTYAFSEGGRMPQEGHCAEAVDPSLDNGFRNNPYWPRYAAQYDDAAHAKGTMIRDHNYKLVYRANGASEFYDLQNDPQETVNQIHAQKYQEQIHTMKEEILQWYQNTCDTVPYHRDWRFSKQMIWEKVKAYCPAGNEEEVKERIDHGNGTFFEILLYCQNLAKKQENL